MGWEWEEKKKDVAGREITTGKEKKRINFFICSIIRPLSHTYFNERFSLAQAGK